MKNMLMLFILSISFINAQTYNFDYLIKYSTESSDCKGESVMYVNTLDDNYYLSVSRKQDRLIGILTDSKSKKLHYFTVVETKKKNDILFDFVYDYTTGEEGSFYTRFSNYDFSVFYDSVDTKKDVKTIRLEVYKKLRKKRKHLAYFMLEAKSSSNLFPAFEYCCMHPHQFIQKENPKNLLVTKAVETTKKGQLINYELKTLKEVNFQLVIPKESEIKY